MDFNWKEFLNTYNNDLLTCEDIRKRQTEETLASNWLGYEGAIEEEIKRMENRLNVKLPPSYKAFLRASNGWRDIDTFIYELFSTEKVCWFKEKNLEWIDVYNSTPRIYISDEKYFVYGKNQDSVHFRKEYLYAAIQVSGVGDQAVCLLNPHVIFENGEWEAWTFADWYPGAARYRSFQEMMLDMHKTFLYVLNSNKSEK